MGFEGPPGSVERGTPGWIPTIVEGRELEISSFDAELRQCLVPYGIVLGDLPQRVRSAIVVRQAFTLVEGEQPVGLYKGRIDIENLLSHLVRHEQSALCLEQMDVFATHNGRLLYEGKKLTLPAILPYPTLETPLVFEIPNPA
jgi:hypothetical protein